MTSVWPLPQVKHFTGWYCFMFQCNNEFFRPSPDFTGHRDCGTGGLLDALLDRYGVDRLPGSHCYEFFAGPAAFAELHRAELGTFFLTDYLAKHFDSLVMGSLGLDRHPELRDMYFGNYVRVVLLSQTEDPAVVEAGRVAAGQLGLAFEHRHVGLSPFSDAITTLVGAS